MTEAVVNQTMTIKELWTNMSYQYAEKRQEYELEKNKIENVDMSTAKIGKIDLIDLNKLKEDCVKLEGSLETILLVRNHVSGMYFDEES